MDVDILENVNLAKVAAKLAGKNLKDNYESLNITKLEKGRDIKLKADLESEKLIIDFITSQSDYPNLEKKPVSPLRI